ncbi:heme oxygenase (biliverdin-producing) [Planktothrix sp. FACHB-1365]|uniref:biliverdin-producing heme oxygenase n=1 Tax=Planktothrix sp. FACHB-1365 TaxID=2692855 RepID=UPI0016877175|nr:biliverdin-producing heme oxygenase [Planktothrix sp. FACHB-1365]MBD2483735.1 heme oxygenase (biliverdin-producing) [Planktothrix sp. FACHB-1365]
MTNLAEKLKLGTQQSHSNAEHTGFMKNFLSGGISKQSFCQLLSNLYFVYSQLESELQCHQTHPIISKIYFPELNRKANLEKDLTFYYGEHWPDNITPSPAAQAYVSRLRELSATEPILLIAHSYTRYMGDLSGGQSLKKIVQSVFNLEEHQGICFYEFDQIPDLNEFKNQYRQRLNELILSEQLQDQVVAEANNAFTLNIAMLRDLRETPTPVTA